METLVAVLTAWIVATTGLPAPAAAPAVVFADPAAVVANPRATGHGRHVLGAHDDRTGTIHLRADWDRRDPVDVSILVHELVHHVQHRAGLRHACPEAREALAYAAQAAWLAPHGLDLERAFGIDALTLKLRTQCLPW